MRLPCLCIAAAKHHYAHEGLAYRELWMAPSSDAEGTSLGHMMSGSPALYEAGKHENQDQGLCKGIRHQQIVQNICVVQECLKPL